MSEKNISCMKKINEAIRLNQFDDLSNLEEVWVFGYGSLIWRPVFRYSEKIVGKIRGFHRRFYQSDMTYRGTPEFPARVATLLKDPTAEAETYGCAFKLSGKNEISAGIKYLHTREVEKAGYSVTVEEFHSCESPPIPALVYTATTENYYFTGKQSMEELSDIIANASGLAGPNTEYLFRLAEWQREFLPLVEDDHLYELTRMTKEKISKIESEN
ncbi:Oidioi.mRNA.OKI2018_I69.chr2.g4069.t1.cds [Oikopleura dioica]|uniref:Oidioi.mRNA.OKI2018_I69.chr2.g4069.t1.cds n=1 Tax=Oikopleura dioica TaxID=34765 RepID=A0ABN7T1N3_OIKDI|nr:Oidioi.mRNA.OKI2018_I69.chr2.g4069.t1.cds [Oikopleura dioica]